MSMKSPNYQQPDGSAGSVQPKDAKVFAGEWFDSLGNAVTVEEVGEAPTVTLKKDGSREPKTLRLFFDTRYRCWRCGNGYSYELRYQDNAEKVRVLQLIAWKTWDGRVSTWTRVSSLQPRPGTEVPSDTNSAPKFVTSVETVAVASPPVNAPEAAPTSEGSNVKADMPQRSAPSTPPSKIKAPQGSWYEITEDDDSQNPFSSATQKGYAGDDIDKTLWTIEESGKRSSRRGRRRSGRGSQD
jgi:hypothetical protein